MEGFDGRSGTNKLATVLAHRMKAENDSPLIIDFGEIQTNGSLMTNTFPIPIPKGEYSVCRHVGSLNFTVSGGGHAGHEEQTQTNHTGSHSHDVKPPAIMPGDRVLVAWVQNEAVVVDVIERS